MCDPDEVVSEVLISIDQMLLFKVSQVMASLIVILQNQVLQLAGHKEHFGQQGILRKDCGHPQEAPNQVMLILQQEQGHSM